MSIANLCVLHGYSNGEAWFEGGLGKALSWKGIPGQFLVWYGCGEVKTPTYETDTWGPRLLFPSLGLLTATKFTRLKEPTTPSNQASQSTTY
jgi:hypothetical protein